MVEKFWNFLVKCNWPHQLIASKCTNSRKIVPAHVKF
jgi:hypothetical protein